ncbi:MAG: hypothetical protein JWQ02_4465 [Capsulimonas sp.]|nr:hypothetical protein [Capsulimonas sp.]
MKSHSTTSEGSTSSYEQVEDALHAFAKSLPKPTAVALADPTVVRIGEPRDLFAIGVRTNGRIYNSRALHDLARRLAGPIFVRCGADPAYIFVRAETDRDWIVIPCVRIDDDIGTGAS